MDPTTTAVLAIIAIVVSGLSALAAFWSVAQTAAYHPKPLLLGRLIQVDEGRGVSLRVANRGSGAAHDVAFYVRRKGKKDVEYRTFTTLEPGRKVRDQWVNDPYEEEVVDAYGDAVSINTGTANPWDFSILVTWRQEPNMKKIRREEFTLASVPTGTTKSRE